MIYLDNSATSSIYPEVLDAMIPFLKEEYGNPSSKYYTLAVNASKAVEESREKVASLIGAKPEEIVFTSGSTESTNMIIKGVSDYKRYYENAGNHIITSKVEHHATLNTCRFLNGEIYSNKDASFSLFERRKKVNRGYEVTFLDVNKYGQVDPQNFEEEIRSSTIIASFIWANNEIGSLNDIDSLCKVAHKHNVVLHADGTQIVGKMPVNVSSTLVDFLSFSAHKFHGPKGIGVAYIRSDDYGLPPISSFMHGGNQENGLRGGTLPVHNIVGLGKAAEITVKNMYEQLKKLEYLEQEVRKYLIAMKNIESLGDPQRHLPGVLSIVVHEKNFDNECFIKRNSQKFAVSTGSACTAGMPSHVLQAIGHAEDTSRVLRLSLSLNNTVEQIKDLICEI